MAEKILKREDLRGGTFNQKTQKITRAGGIVVRKESDFLNQGLINEVKFLLSLNKNAKKHFCEVKKYQIDKAPVFYEMPFYNLKTLSKSIVDGDVDAEYCMLALHNMLDFMFKEVFSQNVKSADSGHLSKTIFSRITDRLIEVKEKSAELREFIDARKIVIDGKEYRNIMDIMDELKGRKELIKVLTPKKTHMIHGDFHFDNFLIDSKNPDNFILLDPRGEIDGYTYAYDLGKLWFSFHGLYDFLLEDLFDLKYEVKGDVVVVSRFKVRKSKALDTYKEIYERCVELIGVCMQNLHEENLELQILFNEAAHFCALAPFHLKNDDGEKFALGKYLRGVVLLNEFMEKIGNL